LVRAIRLYIEGGGDSSLTKTKLREGFGDFLAELRQIARAKNIGWTPVACGGRDAAYRDFCHALQSHPEAFNVLLVDSEAPVRAGAFWSYLEQRDRWKRPPGVDDGQCFLMVQCMETWPVADRDALARFYGQGFLPNALPNTADIEEIDRHVLQKALDRATAGARTKGPYHKTKHAFDILKLSDAKKVRRAAWQCDRLFTQLAGRMGASLEPTAFSP